MHNNYIQDSPIQQQKGLSFKRVRIVTLNDNGFMTCSCGYVQRMMMPCSHICCVIQNANEYIPTMFHIRWHKLFSYYYRNQNILNSCNSTREAVENLFSITKSKSYASDGCYNGIYVHDSEFHKRIIESACIKDSIYEKMIDIFNYISTMGPIKVIDGVAENIIECQNNPKRNEEDTEYNSYGCDSQQESNLSQLAKEYQIEDIPKSNDKTIFYEESKPLFQEMISSCRDRESFDRCMNAVRREILQNYASQRKKQDDQDSTSKHLYAENMTNQKRMKRKMTTGEKILRKRK